MKKTVFLLLAALLLGACHQSQSADHPNPNQSNERYVSAVQLYSSITHHYPAVDLEQADALVLDLLQSIQNDCSDFEYARKKELLLNASLNLHNVYEPNTAELKETGFLPIRLMQIGKQVYVIEVSQKSPIPLYAEVLRFDHQEIDDYFLSAYPYLYKQCESPADFDYLLSYVERGKIDQTISVEYKTDEGIKEVTLTYEIGQRWQIAESDEKDYFFQSPNVACAMIGDILYIQAKSFSTAFASEALLKELESPVEKVILDLRENVGGNDLYGIQMIEPFLSNDFQSPKQIYTDLSPKNDYRSYSVDDHYGTFEQGEFAPQVYTLEKAPSSARVAVLIGRECQSACEAVAYYEQQQDNAVLIGETTQGALGNITRVILADGSSVSFPITLAVIDDSTVFEGIAPDIEVPIDIERIQSQKDAALERAIEYLNENEN